MQKSRISKPEYLIGATILFALTTVATPNIFTALANARKAKAINHAKQIGIAMIEFDHEFGHFPSEDSRKKLVAAGKKLPKGDTANHFLGQLLAANILDSEKFFYVDKIPGTKKGDDVFNTPETILGRGENGFGYVMLADGKPLSQEFRFSTLPVVVAPLLKGGKNPTFQRKLFNGEGVYLKLDSSVGTCEISKKGELLFRPTGKDLFSTEGETIWGKDTPDVKEPWPLEEKKMGPK